MLKPKRTTQPGQVWPSQTPTGKKREGQVEAAVRAFDRKRDNGKGKNRVTRFAEDMLHGEGKKIMRTVIERAMQGCPTCLKLCMERLIPVKKDRIITLDVPKVTSLQEVPGAISRVMQQVFDGEVTLSEGKHAIDLLRGWSESVMLSKSGDEANGITDIAKKLRDASLAMDMMVGLMPAKQVPTQEGQDG